MQMDWKILIQDLMDSGLSQVRIAHECDTGQSHISSLYRKARRSPNWSLGQRLIDLHASRCPDKAWPSPIQHGCSHGFTLIELLVTITVLAIIATIAVPSFQDMVQRNQISTAINELIGALHVTRNEAIRRNKTVRFCINKDTGAWQVGNPADDSDKYRVGGLRSSIAITPSDLDSTDLTDFDCLRLDASGAAAPAGQIELKAPNGYTRTIVITAGGIRVQ